MPWKIEKKSGRYCVVKETDGSTVACHDTEDEALAQQRALWASEKRASSIKALDVPGDEDSEDGLLVFGWESAKTLGRDGEFVGYLWRWGSPELPDATKFKDYFTPQTHFGRYVKGEVEGYLHHALPIIKGKPNPSGDNSIGLGTVTPDGEGGWLKARLDLSVPGAGDTWDSMKADDDIFGLSSGAISHLVRRELQPGGAHWIRKWPLVEWSITPDPAERRTAAVAVKSLEVPYSHPGHDITTLHESTDERPGAASALTLDDDLLRLATDAERLCALTVQLAGHRKAEGRDLSHRRLDSIKAVTESLGKLLREHGVAAAAIDLPSTPPEQPSDAPFDLAAFAALIERAKVASRPNHRL
jgi:hypothetical protein